MADLRATGSRLVHDTWMLRLFSVLFVWNCLVGVHDHVLVKAAADGGGSRPNILFIMTDQQRYDAIRRTQDDLPEYKRKLKIRTPNLDRLSREGAYFRNAYTQCAVCGPARTVLRTGCTIERTGVQTNALADSEVLFMEPLFNDKIEALSSLDQILAEDYGYTVEYYGKWHIPERLYYTRDGSSNSIRYNDFDYEGETPRFSLGAWQSKLIRYLNYAEFDDNQFTSMFEEGDQRDTYSRRPYTPIYLDSRFGYPTNTELTASAFEYQERIQPSVMGAYSLDEFQTATYYNADTVLRAIDRVVDNGEFPFMITASLHHPHPPMMATEKYLEYYWDNRDRLLVPPNLRDPLDNSGYVNTEQLGYLERAGYLNATAVQEWTAVYYAMIEEIDDWVGVMLNKLDNYGLTDDTIVIFTSDHGEMLGAHRSREKGKFYEESAKVPLFIKYPKEIQSNVVVEEAVSHLDVLSTLLDYAGASASDDSDGVSVRRYIEGSSYNKDYEENIVVSEWDYRQPLSDSELERPLDERPSFCLWHKGWKLMMHKKADSTKIDMMFNLQEDPFELDNLIGLDGLTASNEVVGKAEHLRILLLEWMRRLDGGAAGYFSDPIHNAGEGRGDITEVEERRRWKRLALWSSEMDTLEFGPAAPAFVDGMYRRNEYLYVGRQTPGTTTLNSITIIGADAALFSFSLLKSDGIAVGGSTIDLREQEYVRIQISYANPTIQSVDELQNIQAYLSIGHNAAGYDPVSISLTFPGPRETLEPTTTPYPSQSPTTAAPTVTPVPTVIPPIPLVVPVVDCGSPGVGLCPRCGGHCDSDAECEPGLICFDKNDQGGVPIPGCIGYDGSRTRWCILPPPPPTVAPLAPPTPTTMSSTIVLMDRTEELQQGVPVETNGFRLAVLSNGVLELSYEGSTAWTSNIAEDSGEYFAILQGDCHLLVFQGASTSGQDIWKTFTSDPGATACSLAVHLPENVLRINVETTGGTEYIAWEEPIALPAITPGVSPTFSPSRSVTPSKSLSPSHYSPAVVLLESGTRLVQVSDFFLDIEDDGNLVLSLIDGSQFWESGASASYVQRCAFEYRQPIVDYDTFGLHAIRNKP